MLQDTATRNTLHQGVCVTSIQHIAKDKWIVWTGHKRCRTQQHSLVRCERCMFAHTDKSEKTRSEHEGACHVPNPLEKCGLDHPHFSCVSYILYCSSCYIASFSEFKVAKEHLACTLRVQIEYWCNVDHCPASKSYTRIEHKIQVRLLYTSTRTHSRFPLSIFSTNANRARWNNVCTAFYVVLLIRLSIRKKGAKRALNLNDVPALSSNSSFGYSLWCSLASW